MKFLHWLRKFILYKLLKLKTIGVRVAIFDIDENAIKILLVRHRYNNLWVFPGGAVTGQQSNISILNQAKIECIEEVSIQLLDPVIKFSEYKNTSGGKNDIVVLFIANSWLKIDKKPRFIDMLEIAESKWFPVSNLPENISFATKNRISEILSNDANHAASVNSEILTNSTNDFTEKNSLKNW